MQDGFIIIFEKDLNFFLTIYIEIYFIVLHDFFKPIFACLFLK
jgi:hypothetical protein